MKYCIILIVLFACGNQSLKKEPQKVETERHVEIVSKITKKNTYDGLSVPQFFQQLCINHQEKFSQKDKRYEQFCNDHSLNKNDSLTKQIFYTSFILHKLFTSQTAYDCSTGDIMNVPYQWHWTTPNPRHEIRFTKDSSWLQKTKPPKAFGKYASYADIDRTPYLYLSDFVQDTPKYFSESCGTFSTFGWCSEREMAFVCLMDMLGYEGKIIVSGAHSWSEYMITLEDKTFKLTIDNTYDGFEWEQLNTQEVKQWRNKEVKEKLIKWYNNKAHDVTCQSKLKKYIVSSQASQRIENYVVKYLQKK